MPANIKNKSWPENVGILAIEIHYPAQYVCQKELECFDGVSEGKYTIGLGQSQMGFCYDSEDINSICLTVLNNLLDKTGISLNDIGRLDVGTETLLDKSKSIKTVLMTLFESSGNLDIEGVDSTNACYGGTAALFNALNWIESSAWDGRFALVVAGDIAIYAEGSARPTGGAGAVAMLIGPNAPLVVDRGVRSSHMMHAYDFYKPNLASDYPTVDGKLSIKCYLSALDRCYQGYLRKAASYSNKGEICQKSLPECLKDFDAFAFHTPYCKLVQKSFARIAFNDFILSPDKQFPECEKFRNLKFEETYFDRDVEKSFMAVSKELFEAKTKPSLVLANRVGNMYTPSVYGGILSILASSPASELEGQRIGVFSYGSGFAASMYSISVRSDSSQHLAAMVKNAQEIIRGLDHRTKVSPKVFVEVLAKNELNGHKASHTPTSDLTTLNPGTWYLTHVDEMHRRTYNRTPIEKTLPTTPVLISDQFSCSMVNVFSNGYKKGNNKISNGSTGVFCNGVEDKCSGMLKDEIIIG